MEQKKVTGTNQEAVSGTRVRRKPGQVLGVATERDALACRFVCEQGVMTVEQLWRAVWWSPESNSPRYAYDRVSFLERAGFLVGIRTAYSLKTFFKATRMAQELAMSHGEGPSLIPLATPPQNEIGHSDGLTELRLAVIRADKLGSAADGAAPWRTDRVLAVDPAFPKERFYGHMPDAIWTTQSGKRVAVEYERTRKVVSRLRLKVETFSREIARPDRAFDLVLWIGVPGTLPTLTQALASHPAQKLRTMGDFIAELKTPQSVAGSVDERGRG